MLFLLLINALLVAVNADESLKVEVTKSYKLAPGDTLMIKVFGESDLTLETTLGNDAKISYPFLGEISVAGLTLTELQEVITKGLKGEYLVDPDVTVNVTQYRPFFINGQVASSGSYPFQPNLTVRKAIALAGGLTEHASQDKITIIREYDPEKKPSQATLETVVFAGDIISIQEYKQVFINGEVKRPGGYSFQKGLTLRKAIAIAGGFTLRADKSRILVIHDKSVDNKPEQIQLDDMVLPGDIVTVNQSFF